MPFPLAPFLASLAPSVVQGVGALFASGANANASMKLAEYTADRNEAYMNQMLNYNTPLNQRKRMEDAGYNPALFYGQGNPGNQSAPLQFPQANPRDFSKMLEAIPMFNQSRLVGSQVQAMDSNVVRNIASAELSRVQTEVARANPLLDKGYLSALVSSMKSAASIKASEARLSRNTADFMTSMDQVGTALISKGHQKMQAELDLLVKRGSLAGADQKIKAQVLQSKEFQNAILEVQKRFMTDADITPQHILTFIQLLLMKLL